MFSFCPHHPYPLDFLPYPLLDFFENKTLIMKTFLKVVRMLYAACTGKIGSVTPGTTPDFTLRVEGIDRNDDVTLFQKERI